MVQPKFGLWKGLDHFHVITLLLTRRSPSGLQTMLFTTLILTAVACSVRASSLNEVRAETETHHQLALNCNVSLTLIGDCTHSFLSDSILSQDTAAIGASQASRSRQAR